MANFPYMNEKPQFLLNLRDEAIISLQTQQTWRGILGPFTKHPSVLGIAQSAPFSYFVIVQWPYSIKRKQRLQWRSRDGYVIGFHTKRCITNRCLWVSRHLPPSVGYLIYGSEFPKENSNNRIFKSLLRVLGISDRDQPHHEHPVLLVPVLLIAGAFFENQLVCGRRRFKLPVKVKYG